MPQLPARPSLHQPVDPARRAGARQHPALQHPDRLTAASHRLPWLTAAMLWLLVGSALLVTTLVPVHTRALGWTPAFWLLGAPLIVLLGLWQPASRGSRWTHARGHTRARDDGAVWH